MHVMLAEDIGGWLIAGAFFFGGMGSSILALGALFPASRGNWPLTFLLIAPAIIIVLAISFWLGYGYVKDGVQQPDELSENYIKPWIIMAGLPLITSLVAGVVLCVKKRTAPKN